MNDFLHPHEPALDEVQRRWLLDQTDPGAQVLDLGCGGGRLLVPLAQAGVRCTGVDHDRSALEDCRARLRDVEVEAVLIQQDFRSMLEETLETWDVVLCLGNTWCLIWQVEEAVALLQRIKSCLRPGGKVVIDDIPGDLWPEVTGGGWQEGIDPESGAQLIWANDDAVFTLRSPERADPEDWTLGPEDQRLRLWTAGALELVARAAGYESPQVASDSGVRILTPQNVGDCPEGSGKASFPSVR